MQTRRNLRQKTKSAHDHPHTHRDPLGDNPNSSSDALLEALVDRQEPLRQATELHQARERLISLFSDLPSSCRAHVFSSETRERHSGRYWSLQRIDACYDRLVDFEGKQDDAELFALLARARELRQRMEQAREALVLANLGIVPHIVREFVTGVIPYSDLVQDGYVGLLKAVDRFDPARGSKFSTYAYWWIRRAMSDAFTYEARLIRLPDSVRKDLRHLRRVSQDLSADLGRRPTEQEAADRMRVTLRKVKKLIAIVRDPSALEDLPAYREEGWNRIPRESTEPGPLEAVLEREQQELSGKALQLLKPREHAIIRLRFGFEDGEGLTLKQIGRLLGLSRERVRQIECEALQRIRRWAQHHGIERF